jgi:hypothetical protein
VWRMPKHHTDEIAKTLDCSCGSVAANWRRFA